MLINGLQYWAITRCWRIAFWKDREKEAAVYVLIRRNRNSHENLSLFDLFDVASQRANKRWLNRRRGAVYHFRQDYLKHEMWKEVLLEAKKDEEWEELKLYGGQRF